MTTVYKSRSDWTTHKANGSAMPSKPKGLAVHYPGDGNITIGAASESAIAKRLESYRAYHVNTRGWSDIAYQVGIDQAGRVWDLRGIDRESAANGDQSVNLTYGACIFVVGNNEPLSAAAIQAFKDWHKDKWLAKYPGATKIVGHQDIRPGGGTDCPGKPIEALVKSNGLSDGSSTTPSKPSKPPVPSSAAPKFPLGKGQYFGPKLPLSNSNSVSGYYSHSADLKKWQQRMADRGWSVAPDGLYGNETAQVAKQFQSEKHLSVDGLIGPDTWSAAWTEKVT